MVKRVPTSFDMSERVITKILAKRVTTDDTEEYLVECVTRGKTDKTGQQWLTCQQLQHYEQLVDDFEQQSAELEANHSMTRVNGHNGHQSSDDSEPKNGFDKGFHPYKILGAKSDNNNQLMFLVMFKEDLTKADLIPSHVLHQKCPQLLIKFYEKNILWERQHDC